jgi:hypothetical protein
MYLFEMFGRAIIGGLILCFCLSGYFAHALPPFRQQQLNTPRLQLTISPQGQLVQLFDKRYKRTIPVQWQTTLGGCEPTVLQIEQEKSGAILLVRRFTVTAKPQPADADAPPVGMSCLAIEYFAPEGDDIRWSVEIKNESSRPWSTTVATESRVPPDSALRFWTSWGDPRVDAPRPGAATPTMTEAEKRALLDGNVLKANLPATDWADPLVMQPLRTRTLWYGAPMYDLRQGNLWWNPLQARNYFGVPLVALSTPGGQWGVSLGFSPDDIGIEANLITTPGMVSFNRMRNRFTPGSSVKFTTYLRLHEADWRAALGAYVRQFPGYFKPKNPQIHEFEGTASYAWAYDSLAADKLRQMSYRTNWDATFGFLYMGLFLPPVSAESGWLSWRGEPVSFRSIDEKYRRFQEKGFHVLSYFNVTEYGNYVVGRQDYVPRTDTRTLWVNANKHLHEKLEPALVLNPTAPTKYIYTYEKSVVMDPGEPVYRDLMLEQAQRHLDRLSRFEGFAVDRGDWLRLYNLRRDDGLSWFANSPARSLHVSWRQLWDTLGPMLHNRNKVVMLNNHVKRLDHLRHVDGIFDEFGYGGASLNANAFLTVQKPFIGWCANKEQLGPDPDAYMQRYLHLGLFPMAPFPANDHALLPDAETNQLFTDYGPMFDALRGKNWVLEPDVVSVEGNVAKVNLFTVAPNTYVLPITFGGKARTATVRSPKFPPDAVVEFRHPGSHTWQSLRMQGQQLVVPLYRGMALVRVTCG